MDFIADSQMWLLYIGLFIAPFVQEDSAVIGAASLSVSDPTHGWLIFTSILAGLIASDSWKYWLGWAAKHHRWAQKHAKKERVLKLQTAILNNSVKTLLSVRFIPFARIPTYLAAGFFGMPYLKYWLSISLSALLYISMIFAGFHILGEIMGEAMKRYMPIVAIILVSSLIIFLALYRRKRMERPHNQKP